LSEPHSRRRASLKALRIQGRWIIGFAERGSKQIVDLNQCTIMAGELIALIAPLRQFLAKAGQKSKAIEIAMTLVDSGVDLLLKGLKADGLRSAEALIHFAQAHGLARLSVDEGFGPETRWEPEPVTITLGGVSVPFGHQAFLQATCSGEQALVAAVQQWAVGERIADLFAGLGTFSLTQKPTAKVYAAEADRAAITNLQAAGRQAGRQIFADHRDLFRRPLQPAELNRFSTVILDPPRAGARDQVAELAKSELANLIYVSCNPSSFARDAKQLIDGGFRLRHIQPVGQFLWSTHVELAAHFVR
jgi:23S rRNA (uracil1939-C5)-methyltransferase